MDKSPYVYVYSYPDGYLSSEGTDLSGIVFYVGKGKGNRIIQHDSEVKRGTRHNPYFSNTLQKIWDMGKLPERKKVAVFPTDEEAYMYEIALIFFMRGLTNLTDGGVGSKGLPSSFSRKHKPRPPLSPAETKDSLEMQQVAKMLKVSVDTIRRMIKRKELEAVKVGSQLRIKAASLQKYL